MIVVAAYALILAHPGPAFKESLSIRETAKWELAPQENKFEPNAPTAHGPGQRDALLRDGEAHGWGGM